MQFELPCRGAQFRRPQARADSPRVFYRLSCLYSMTRHEPKVPFRKKCIKKGPLARGSFRVKGKYPQLGHTPRTLGRTISDRKGAGYSIMSYPPDIYCRGKCLCHRSRGCAANLNVNLIDFVSLAYSLSGKITQNLPIWPFMCSYQCGGGFVEQLVFGSRVYRKRGELGTGGFDECQNPDLQLQGP